jgi:hypothetical protein
MAVMNQPAPTSERVASPPAAVEAVRTSATGLFAHGAKVDALDTPVGTMVAFAGPVAADGTVTLDSLDAPPEEPAKPTDAGGEAASGTATTGTERMAKGRGTIVALAPDSVQVEVDDGPLAGQTITMPAPAPDPSCTPEVGASVGFEAASSDGGTTWHLVLLST